MRTLITSGSEGRRRKGAALVGLSLSLPLIAIGAAAPAGAGTGADTPFAGGVFSSTGSYTEPGSTDFASVDAAASGTSFGNAQLAFPDGTGAFDGLAYNPVDNYLYTTMDPGAGSMSVSCTDVVQVTCAIEAPAEALAAAAPGADIVESLDAATGQLLEAFAGEAQGAAEAQPQQTATAQVGGLPGVPDLYRLDAEGDLARVGSIAAPPEPAVPSDPGLAISHSAALGFAAGAAADGTYLIPGVQLSVTLDMDALYERIFGEPAVLQGGIEAQALEPIGSPLLAALPELNVEAGLLVGRVDPATAATSWVDVDLSAPSCLGVSTYAAEGQLSLLLSSLLATGGLEQTPSPEMLLGGLLDWAVRPSDGLLYAYVTPGLAGLLFPNSPEGIYLTVDPDSGTASCTPFGASGLPDLTMIDPAQTDVGALLGEIADAAQDLYAVGGTAFTPTGDLMLWNTTGDQVRLLPGASLDACLSGDAGFCMAPAITDPAGVPVIGDLASDPFPDLSVTPTTSSGAPAGPFGFTLSAGGYDFVELAKDQTGTYLAIPTSQLTITETVPAGFDLVAVTCLIDGVSLSPPVVADAVTITVSTAADASCVFLHDPEPALVVAAQPAPELAATGADDTVPLTVLGLSLMLGGAGMTVASRRRSRV